MVIDRKKSYSWGEILTFFRVVFNLQDAGFFYYHPSFEGIWWPPICIVILNLRLHVRVLIPDCRIMDSCHDTKEFTGFHVFCVCNSFPEHELGLNSDGIFNVRFVGCYTLAD